MEIDLLADKSASDVRIFKVMFVAIDPSRPDGFPSNLTDRRQNLDRVREIQ